ncbi:hypothetical protein [Mesorhizobium sp. CN2-181]|uniref:hypothetical protein n=1 Tax=Mesorhizobium yinganensis TaxID=3157707 RepID=UPI0032B7514E
MPWILNIATIDVGQGESALIIARDTGPGGASRTMLIDGGRALHASTVNNFVAGQLALHGVQEVNVIVTSHFDVDHSGGVVALLQADIFEASAEIVGAAAARAAIAAIAAGRVGQQVIVAAAAAGLAATLGAYDVPGGPQRANIADLAGQDTHGVAVPLGTTNAQAAALGIPYGDHRVAITLGAMNPVIVRNGPRQTNVASDAGVLAGTVPLGTALGPRAMGATGAAFTAMAPGIPATARFRTFQVFRNAILVDPGAAGATAGYLNSVAGTATFTGGATITVPTAVHNRRSLSQPDLTDEVLWDTLGGGAALAPAGSPAAFVVAANGWMWEVPPALAPIPGGAGNNGLSIGLVLRFGNFYFYTGGDLTTVGEDALAATVMAQALPNPQGGAPFPAPLNFAAFKAGHHGADGSTSTAFINALSAPVAVISVGGGIFNGVAHPGPAAIGRLHANGNIGNFYLTNCQFQTGHIPSSFGVNQIFPPPGGPIPPPAYPAYAPNKSRVAGDNGLPNLTPGRPRGDIVINVTQANANAGPGGRTFDISYFDDDAYFGVTVGPTVVAQAF